MATDSIYYEVAILSRKLLKLLSRISQNLKDLNFESEDLLETIHYDESDLVSLPEELEGIEMSRALDDDSLDILKALLVYILLRDSAYEAEDIYSFVFGGGKRIIWN